MKKGLIIPLSFILLFFSMHQFAHAGALANNTFIESFNTYYRVADKGGIPKLMELGMKAYDSGLTKQAKKCFSEVIHRDPDHKEANIYMGNIMYEKNWMTREARDKMILASSTGKVLWGKELVSEKLYSSLLASEQTARGWKFNYYYNRSDDFTLYYQGELASSFSVHRLLESFFSAWSLEFAKNIGKLSDPLPINIFSSKEAYEQYFSTKFGTKPPEGHFYDKETGLFTYCGKDGSRQFLTREIVAGMLKALGCKDPTGKGYWFYIGIKDYFEYCMTDDETITVGFYDQGGYSLIQAAISADRNGLIPSFERFFSATKENFETDMAEFGGLCYPFFFVLNHEFQGYYKKTFQGFLKQAVKGRGGYAAMKKIKNWGVIEKCMRAWLSMSPKPEDK